MTDTVLPPISEETDEAWRCFRESLENARRRVLATAWVHNPLTRAQALYFLQMQQVTAFAKYLAPRQAYPSLNIHLEFMPFELTTGQSNPDFLYRWAYLDGKRAYRLWGRNGTTRWTDIQVSNGHWGDERMDLLGNYTLSTFEMDTNGAFEIIFSATPRDGNWIRLDPESANNVVLIRETWADWEHERGVEMKIEALDLRGDEPVVYDEAEFNRRLRAAAKFIDYSTNFSIGTTSRILQEVGRNVFLNMTPPPKPGAAPRPKVGGSNPLGNFDMMIYDLDPDEALLIEWRPPQAKYWGFSLGDVWFASTDYSYHQSSVNDVQAELDPDGIFRGVLSFKDPGVPNWLDVVGSGFGLVILRRYISAPDASPKARLVRVDEVRRHLPASTRHVSPDERRAAIARRTRASLARYGF